MVSDEGGGRRALSRWMSQAPLNTSFDHSEKEKENCKPEDKIIFLQRLILSTVPYLIIECLVSPHSLSVLESVSFAAGMGL